LNRQFCPLASFPRRFNKKWTNQGPVYVYLTPQVTLRNLQTLTTNISSERTEPIHLRVWQSVASVASNLTGGYTKFWF